MAISQGERFRVRTLHFDEALESVPQFREQTFLFGAFCLEEVECGDHFAVIAEEGEPTFRLVLITMTFQPLKIARDGRLGNFEPELEQFAVNTRGTPSWIVR